jgi:hypothetical protein
MDELDYEVDQQDDEVTAEHKREELAARRAELQKANLSLSAPLTTKDLNVNLIVGQWYKPKKAIKEVVRMVELLTYATLCERGAMHEDGRVKVAEQLYRGYARMLCLKKPPFDDEEFNDSFILPLFMEERGIWFTPGALVITTTPSLNKPSKCREGRSIIQSAKKVRAQCHILEGFFERYLGPDRKPPTGKTYEDILEYARKHAYLSKRRQSNKPRSDAAASASQQQADEAELDDEYDDSTFSMKALDEASVPTSYMPSGWLAFVKWGPYGINVLKTDPLAIMTDDPEEQNALRVPRVERKARDRAEKAAESKAVEIAPSLPNNVFLQQFNDTYKNNSDIRNLQWLINDVKSQLKEEDDEDVKVELRSQLAEARARLMTLMKPNSGTVSTEDNQSSLTSSSTPTPATSTSSLFSTPPSFGIPTTSEADSIKHMRNQETSSTAPPGSSKNGGARSANEPVKKRVRRTKAERESGLSIEEARAARNVKDDEPSGNEETMETSGTSER